MLIIGWEDVDMAVQHQMPSGLSGLEITIDIGQMRLGRQHLKGSAARFQVARDRGGRRLGIAWWVGAGRSQEIAHEGNQMILIGIQPIQQSLLQRRAHRMAPRAETGQTHSTRPPRTPTYQSCRLTVGSQCPGMSRTLSPIISRLEPVGRLTRPCSSAALT